MIGKHILEITNDIEKTGRYEEYLKVIETGKTFYREDIVGSNKDDWRHVIFRAFKAGSGMGLIISDVTDAVHSETQYRKLFELSNDAIFLQDFDSKIVDVNARACALLGYSKEQLLTMKIQDLHPSEESGDVGRNQVITEGAARFSRQFIRSDGKIIDVEISSSVVDRKDDLILGIVRDVSELRKKGDRLNALHINSTKIVSAQSLEEISRITFDAIESVLGFHQGVFAIIADDVMRCIHLKNIKMKAPFDLRLSTPSIMARAVKTGETQLVPNTSDDEDFLGGEDHSGYNPLSALVVPVKQGNKVIAVINVESLEVDAFTRQDAMLLETLSMHVSVAMNQLEQMQNLEDAVREKTRELVSAERMVVAGRIASMVGHDIRGPLQTIRGAIFLLKNSPDSLDEMIGIIDRSADRAQTLID